MFFETGMVRHGSGAGEPGRPIAVWALRLDEHEAAAGAACSAVPRSDEFLQKDMAFHREIAAISGNAIYVALSQAMFEWLAEFHTGLVRLHGAEGLTISGARGDLRAGSPRGIREGAAEAMTAHLTRANALYRQFERAAGN